MRLFRLKVFPFALAVALVWSISWHGHELMKDSVMLSSPSVFEARLDEIQPRSIIDIQNSSFIVDIRPTESLSKEHAELPNHTKGTTDISAQPSTASVSSTPRDYHSIWKYPLPRSHTTTSTNSTRAIVLLSMGPGAAASTLVERCLISIRLRGQYMGPVLVLTDASYRRFQYLTQEDPQLIIVHPVVQDWRLELKRDLPYKRFKTYILSYLRKLRHDDQDSRLQHVSTVYYLDIDLVVGQNMIPWFNHVESTYFESSYNHDQLLFFEGDYSPLQGGQFVMQVGRSEACLEEWRYYMDVNVEEHKDQVSLAQMWDNQQRKGKSNCTLFRMPQEPFLVFLSTKDMASLKSGGSRGDSITDSYYPTLMHIKNTHHAQTIPKRIQEEFYQHLLQLPKALVVQNITAKKRIRPNKTWTEEQIAHGYDLT